MGPAESPSDVSTWGIFPIQAAAEAYAATFASSSSPAAAEGEGAETASTIQSFSDAMSAIVYASRGTVVISRKKKKRKKIGAGSGFAAVYKGGAGGGTWTWTLRS